MGVPRFDLGKFPDLVAQRFGIETRQRLAAALARVGDERNNCGTLLGGN